MIERLIQLWTRIQAIPAHEIVIEFALIWLVVWLIFRFLKGTRAARMFKGLGVILVVASLLVLVLARENAFQRIEFLLRGFLGFAALALVVIFQPELRRALVRLGEARLFRGISRDVEPIIDEIIRAVSYLSKNKIGAIVAMEREVPLGGIIEAGTRIDSEVSASLIQTIFWPGSALHDMGMVIRDGKIAAAGVQFPLAEGEDIRQELGSRHRAALGLSEEADCLVIVVSEETGDISLAERGQLVRKLSAEALRAMLIRGMAPTAETALPPEPEADIIERAAKTKRTRKVKEKEETEATAKQRETDAVNTIS